MYENRARAVGAVPVLVSMTDDNEFDVHGLLAAVTERTKVVFLCTPNNPTGNRLEETAIRRILGLGLPTVIDEAYYEFSEEPASLAHLIAEYPNAIIIRTFSKAYGLAGLRLGYSLSHPVVARLLGRLKLPWNVNAITVAAAMAVLEDTEEFESRMSRLREGRAYLVRELSQIPGIDAVPSDGNFVLVDTTGSGIRAEALVGGMLSEGVLIRSLAVHHAGRSFVRVTVGNEAQNTRCVDAMRRVVSRQSRATLSVQDTAVAPGYDAE